MGFFVKKVPKILRSQKFLTEFLAEMAQNRPIENYDPNRSPLERILDLDQNLLSYAFLKYCHTQNLKKNQVGPPPSGFQPENSKTFS